MKNILNAQNREELLTRITNLKETNSSLWGKMYANEMLCHLADQIRIATNQIKTRDFSSFFSRTILSKIVLLGMPAPKGKVKTFPEIDLAKGRGTKPTDFENDKTLLKKIVSDFLGKDSSFNYQSHAAFGHFTRKQWGRIIYIHFDYHLKQFGA
ncbi:MAG: hypothetical protein COZ80_13215 [Ignavibacteria bacterium CG_4_8_14_3_um_filter_37_9]|nr:DUF1569 domain-containing protein [Ignavibacteria bacterium]OIO16319.1 MAG: hypothetical protein AUJ54_11620 [Ignavibacteria bacterium CG1_02_37_35]PIS45766.1 MAG: hypothetical protein COT22_03545 [Ignavibacteria bacterium CG08_land_8_20_14_0_20_37_9]PIW97930.1 MAG: hypothetical protein COZ80_13215 [Ignavibacteria bacterium CG_4_8_14_3_um_filter_37_9]PIX93928.1 MAG: hypothetical protein COZ25_08205 [Ignavibacteria bacterium CG_4_10_14_3_um_filter_37_18]